MTNYPYYIATRYDAGILNKIAFGVRGGRKFKTWSDCAEAVRRYLKNFPIMKEQQILILEYSNQYESKIIEICQGDEWTSVAAPIKLM
jgi:hypothetical protein